MSTRNREKRAAKRKQRAQRGPTEPRAGGNRQREFPRAARESDLPNLGDLYNLGNDRADAADLDRIGDFAGVGGIADAEELGDLDEFGGLDEFDEDEGSLPEDDRDGLDRLGHFARFAEDAGFADHAVNVDVMVQALISTAAMHPEERPPLQAWASVMDRVSPRGQRTAHTAAGAALVETVERLYQNCWCPIDVWEWTRRRCAAETTELLVDAIAAEAATGPRAGGLPHWDEQRRQFDARVWWDRAEPHLGQWASARGLSTGQALRTTMTLLVELVTLPALPRTSTPASTLPRSIAPVGGSVDRKVLNRVRSLLAKAESTGYPEEAEALSAKAQELMNRHAFEQALLDAETDREQRAGSSRLWLDNPYVDAKAQLVAAIAHANRCRSVFYPHFGFVSLVGHDLDLQITELLATSLLVQATQAMLAHGSQHDRRGQSRTRSFRRAFLISYAARVGERLRHAGEAAHEPREDQRLLPVLAERSKVVEDTFAALHGDTVRKTVQVSSSSGWLAGRAAADEATLNVERTEVES